MKRTSLALLFACTAVFASSGARADFGPKINAGWWGSAGVPLAVGTHAPVGLVTGVEVSAFHIDEDRYWVGGYADGVRDFGTDAWRLSVGPELGLSMFGIDAGYVLQRTEGETRHGFAVRPMFTLGLLALFCRVEHLRGGDPTTFAEVGLLAKLPFEIDVEPYARWY